MIFKEMLKVFPLYQNYLISTHVNPDPDALASQLAIGLYLKSLGKKVVMLNEAAVPDRLKFMPQTKKIKSLDDVSRTSYDALVVVDCGDLDRIGAVSNVLKDDKPVFNIDHHITNKHFGEYNLVIPTASSTAEVLFDLLKKDGFELTADMSVLLYLGIMTDTGSFKYDTTSAHTHAVVSELMRYEFSVSDLYRNLYETIPLNDLKYFTEVVNHFDSLYKGRVICLELYKDIKRKFSKTFDLRDKIFNYLRSINGVEVLVIFTEQGKNKTRVNFRSQGDLNVADLAFHFSGGGHSRASGCLVEGDVKEARKKVLAKLRKMLP